MKKRIVAVKHSHKKNAKEYWFNVPKTVTCSLQVGDIVYCDTCRGDSKGYITKIIEIDDTNGAESVKLIQMEDGGINNLAVKLLLWCNTAFELNPTKDVIGKKMKFNIEDIKISKNMRRTRPGIEKLQGKLAEYYLHGKSALSPIAIKSSGELVDGYTTYLIHKMFDLPVKYVIVV